MNLGWIFKAITIVSRPGCQLDNFSSRLKKFQHPCNFSTILFSIQAICDMLSLIPSYVRKLFPPTSPIDSLKTLLQFSKYRTGELSKPQTWLFYLRTTALETMIPVLYCFKMFFFLHQKSWFSAVFFLCCHINSQVCLVGSLQIATLLNAISENLL